MISQKANRKLSVGSSAVVIAVTSVIAGGVEIQALKAKDVRDHPMVKQDAAECLRCHSDQKTIAMMRLKEGGTNYLFKSDGTFKDAQFAGLTANYHHKTSVSGLPQVK